MIFVRWKAAQRHLSATEVHTLFDAVTDRVLLFAFETHAMTVEAHAGLLSFKMVARGSEEYAFDRRRVRIEPGTALLVNAGDRYASEITRDHTRSIAFFLPHAWVTQAVHASVSSDATLLDAPVPAATSPEVPRVPFRQDPTVQPLARRLAHAALCLGAPHESDLEEFVMRLARAALAQALGLVRPGAFDARMRRATRDELITRVLRARDLMSDRRGSVTLHQAAAVACLSPFHFLRAFRAVIGETPGAFARRLRLERGAEEWRRTGSARRGAVAAGFSSASAFLRALRASRQP